MVKFSLKKMRCVLAVVAVVLLARGAASSFAAVSPRPMAGIGVLVIRSLNPDITVDTLMLYDEPGLQRIATKRTSSLPALTAVVQTAETAPVVAVLKKKSDWLLIAYDEAGREGWVERQRSWEYASWESWLKGRVARLLPGIKPQDARLYGAPSVTAPVIDIPLQNKEMRIIRAQESWVQVLVGGSAVGWLKWRDADGRFLVQVRDRFPN